MAAYDRRTRQMHTKTLSCWDDHLSLSLCLSLHLANRGGGENEKNNEPIENILICFARIRFWLVIGYALEKEKLGEESVREREQCSINLSLFADRTQAKKYLLIFLDENTCKCLSLEENNGTMIGGKPFDVESLLRDCAVKKKRPIHDTIQIYDQQQQQPPPLMQHQATDLTVSKDKNQVGMFDLIAHDFSLDCSPLLCRWPRRFFQQFKQ